MLLFYRSTGFIDVVISVHQKVSSQQTLSCETTFLDEQLGIKDNVPLMLE